MNYNYNETIKVFDNSNLLLKSKNNHKHDILNSNNTNKNKRIRKKYSLFIGNCTNNKNLPTTNFSYFIKDSDINQIKLNYKGDYNVVTIYYNSGKFIFGSAKLAKKLGYTLNRYRIYHTRSGRTIKITTEKKIFSFLKMEYKDPDERTHKDRKILQGKYI